MNELEQGAVIGFWTLKALRPQQIQIQLNGVYHEQAFQLPAAVNCLYALMTGQGTWKMSRSLGNLRKLTLCAQLQSCLVKSH
jgi:hypothetical protein